MPKWEKYEKATVIEQYSHLEMVVGDIVTIIKPENHDSIPWIKVDRNGREGYCSDFRLRKVGKSMFKKDDFKNGMIVKHRDGALAILIDDQFVDLEDARTLSMRNIRDNLTSGWETNDIMEVRQFSSISAAMRVGFERDRTCQMDKFKTGTLLWERDETTIKRATLTCEIKQLEEQIALKKDELCRL